MGLLPTSSFIVSGLLCPSDGKGEERARKDKEAPRSTERRPPVMRRADHRQSEDLLSEAMRVAARCSPSQELASLVRARRNADADGKNQNFEQLDTCGGKIADTPVENSQEGRRGISVLPYAEMHRAIPCPGDMPASGNKADVLKTEYEQGLQEQLDAVADELSLALRRNQLVPLLNKLHSLSSHFDRKVTEEEKEAMQATLDYMHGFFEICSLQPQVRQEFDETVRLMRQNLQKLPDTPLNAGPSEAIAEPFEVKKRKQIDILDTAVDLAEVGFSVNSVAPARESAVEERSAQLRRLQKRQTDAREDTLPQATIRSV